MALFSDLGVVFQHAGAPFHFTTRVGSTAQLVARFSSGVDQDGERVFRSLDDFTIRARAEFWEGEFSSSGETQGKLNTLLGRVRDPDSTADPKSFYAPVDIGEVKASDHQDANPGQFQMLLPADILPVAMRQPDPNSEVIPTVLISIRFEYPDGQVDQVSVAGGYRYGWGSVEARPLAPAGGSGVPLSYDFVSLTDTPDSYSGQGGKIAEVNAAESGLVFVDKPTGGGMGGGLTQSQVEALFATEARAGNADRWGKAKVPSDTVYENTQRFTTALQGKLAALPNAGDLQFESHPVGNAAALNALSRTASSLDFVFVTANIPTGITANTVVDGDGASLTSLQRGDMLVLDHDDDRWVRLVNLPATAVVNQSVVRGFVDGAFVEGLLAGLSGNDRLSYNSLKDTPAAPTLSGLGGLTQSQVDGRILEPARTGSTTRWGTGKVPTLSTLGGLTQSQVDGRIIVAARIGDASRWAKAKLPTDTIYTATQRFTPQLSVKLAGIEDDAKDDQTGPEIVSLLQALTGNARLNATAIRNLPAGGGGGLNQSQVQALIDAAVRSFVVDAVPTAAQETTTTAANTASPAVTVCTLPAVTAAQAGFVRVKGLANPTNTDTTSGGGERITTDLWITRTTQAGVNTTVTIARKYGPRNVSNVDSKRESYTLEWEGEAATGDVFAMLASNRSQVSGRTVRYNTGDNMLTLTPV